MDSVPRLKRVLATAFLLSLLPPLAPQALAQSPSTPCTRPLTAAPPTATRAQAHYRAQLHAVATGRGIKVAIIDTGVYPHPELPPIEAGPDYVAPDNPDSLFDCDFHGTVVAGVIASKQTGIAPGVSVISIRQSSSHYRENADREGSGSLQTLVSAIEAALEAKARVINISVVSCLKPQVAAELNTTDLRVVLDRAERQGVVVVSASGNTGGGCQKNDVVYPAHFPTVIAVTAAANRYDQATYALPGTLSAPGIIPLSPAPGGGWADGTISKGKAGTFQGTSFSAPAISGTVALMLERHPRASPTAIRAMLTASAHPVSGFIDPAQALAQPLPRPHSHPRALELKPASVPARPGKDRLLLTLFSALGLLSAVWLGLGLRKSAVHGKLRTFRK